MRNLRLMTVSLITLAFLSGCVTIPEPNPYLTKGNEASSENRYDEAIFFYKKVLEHAGNNRTRSMAYCKLCYIYYYKKGDKEEAQNLCRKALELDGCLKNAFKIGLKDEVISKLESSIERKEASPKYSNILLRYDYHSLSYYSNKIGLYDKGIRAAKRAIELKPDDAIAYNNLGWAYGMKKKYDEASRAFKKAIEIAPQRATYYNNMGYFLVKKREYKEAVVYLKKAVELEPDYTVAYNNLGWAYGGKGLYDEGEKAFKKAIELRPKEPLYHYNMGVFMLINRNYKGAIECLERAVELASDNRAYLLQLAVAYSVSGRYDDALNAINRVIGDEPGLSFQGREGTQGMACGVEDIAPWIGGAASLMVTGEKDFSSSLIEFLSLRSFIQRHRGNTSESLKDAEKAYRLDSSYEWARLALGAASLDHNQYDEAIELLSQVKEISHARILEATAYAKKQDFQKAIDIYTSIPEEKLFPKNVPLWNDRTTLLVALKAYADSKRQEAARLKAQGRYKEALKELGGLMKVTDDEELEAVCREIAGIMAIEPGLSAIPEEARKYVLRGDVLTEEGNFEAAVKEYRQAVGAAPYIAKLHFNTAMIYGELKKYPQAIRYMKIYLLLAPEAPNARAARDQTYKWEFRMEKGE